MQPKVYSDVHGRTGIFFQFYNLSPLFVAENFTPFFESRKVLRDFKRSSS